MYQHIMVPLDGSELAECILPHVEAIAGGCSVRKVTLVRVVEPFRVPGGMESRFSPEERQRVEETDMNIARSYLDQIAKRLKDKGITAQSEVLYGKVASEIAGYANKNEVDIILLSTHGRSGISRWVWGNVTDRILRSACAPVFMVHAPGCGTSI